MEKCKGQEAHIEIVENKKQRMSSSGLLRLRASLLNGHGGRYVCTVRIMADREKGKIYSRGHHGRVCVCVGLMIGIVPHRSPHWNI